MTRFAIKDAFIIEPIDYFMKMKRFAKKDVFIVKQRLYQGGIRLGHLLNEIFDN